MNHQILDLKRIHLVSWDVDGTLFSYFRLVLELIHGIYQASHVNGWKNIGKRLWKTWEFHKMVEQQRGGMDSSVFLKQKEEAMQVQAWEKEAMQKALRRIRPRQDAMYLLERLSALGTIQVALSDFECQYKLESLGLSRHFRRAYSCQEIGFWKPSPVPLAKIQNDFGIRPEQHLHIGDRFDADGQACIRNGCHFLPVNQLFIFQGKENR
ncbi:HAD family hydrolase [bacterium]|nr:HAD family hydrolase [bacterium]